MTTNGFSSYELFINITDFQRILQQIRPLFLNKHFFISRLLNIVQRRFCVPTSETDCSSYFMRTSPAKSQFQTCPFSANTRSEKARTPPDRSAAPYYVESFQFQPGSMERKFKISKVLSKTLPRRQFSGLTADSLNKIFNFQAGVLAGVLPAAGQVFGK